MNHIAPLIYDLAFILSTAGVVLLIFRWLGQPIVLGYLMAGVLLSPHTTIFPSVRDPENIKIWAEIGVIFLLFGLGLEFSLRKLVQVGRTSVIAALVEVSIMIFLGFSVGRLLQWSFMDSLFLGGILAISSTAIIIRAFEELKLKRHKFTHSVYGILIIEDIVAVLLLVVLSTIGLTKTFSGEEMAGELFRLGYYLLLWFLVGLFLVPLFLKKARSLLTDEMSLIVGLGLCLMMVMFAGQAGFSPALGAFVMGSILAETHEGQRIDRLFIPIRNLFAAIFFVSVGMLIDVALVWTLLPEILLITTVLVIGKFFGVTLGLLLAGKPLEKSVAAGTSMAQIGEFSFLIATLGLNLKMIRPEIYPLAISVSALSTFLTPYFIQRAPWIHKKLEKKIPVEVLQALVNYQKSFANLGRVSLVPSLIRAIGLKIVFNLVLVIAFSIFAKWLYFTVVIPGERTSLLGLGAGLVDLVVVSPFLWAIWLGRLELQNLSEVDAKRIQKFHIPITVLRTLLVIYLVVFALGQFIPIEAVSGLLLIIIGVLLVTGRRLIRKWYLLLEGQFLSQVNMESSSLLPWDVNFGEYELHPHSSLVGVNLENSRLKSRFGVTVSLIRRGERTLVPSSKEILMPYDHIFLVGEEHQLAAAAGLFSEEEESPSESVGEDMIGLRGLMVDEQSEFMGLAIRDCGIKEKFLGLIVGVERGPERFLNPSPDFILKNGDQLWILGDLRKI